MTTGGKEDHPPEMAGEHGIHVAIWSQEFTVNKLSKRKELYLFDVPGLSWFACSNFIIISFELITCRFQFFRWIYINIKKKGIGKFIRNK